MPKAPPLPLLWRPESGRLEDGRPHSRESRRDSADALGLHARRNVALDSLVLTQDVELGFVGWVWQTDTFRSYRHRSAAGLYSKSEKFWLDLVDLLVLVMLMLCL
jgi:hypothetical protein